MKLLKSELVDTVTAVDGKEDEACQKRVRTMIIILLLSPLTTAPI
jgi:hypothetical protein